MRRGYVGLAAVLVLLSTATARAQLVPAGGEFQVNTYTTGAQDIPQDSRLAGGAFVVVWQSQGQDGAVDGIFAQRYDSAGAPLGGEFLVNTFTTANQQRPAVGADPTGNFVVVWQSYGQESTNSFGVFGQRFASDGSPAGGEFQASTYTTNNQIRPVVTLTPSGDFTIVWASYSQAPDPSFGIFAQRFTSAGGTAGGEFQVNTYTSGSQYHPAIGLDDMGRPVVVWDGADQDGNGLGVFGQRFGSGGAPIGGEFQANSTATGNQYRPGVAVAPAGSFVVVWNGPGVGDGLQGIFAQRFDSAGAPAGSEFLVNTYTTATQYRPAVATDAAGNFAVVWQSYGQESPDSFGIFGQQFAADGAPLGGEFQVNAYTTYEQSRPGIAPQSGGDFVVVWRSYGQDAAFSFGAFGQRYQGPTIATTTTTTLTTATTTTTTTLPRFAIGVKVTVIKPGKLFKFVSKGAFTLPDPATDNPTSEGGSLSFSGTTGGQTYSLPASCWKGLGPGGDGSKGFKCKDATCKRVLVKAKVLKGVCKRDTGDFGPLPEPGPVDIVLTVGTGTTRYCASCGGTLKGNAGKIFKRKNCAAPAACP